VRFLRACHALRQTLIYEILVGPACFMCSLLRAGNHKTNMLHLGSSLGSFPMTCHQGSIVALLADWSKRSACRPLVRATRMACFSMSTLRCSIPAPSVRRAPPALKSALLQPFCGMRRVTIIHTGASLRYWFTLDVTAAESQPAALLLQAPPSLDCLKTGPSGLL
jgi:hypothetical protein